VQNYSSEVEEASSVATQFLTHVLINFQKNPEIAKKH
jgi:hypothetical protein